MEFFVGVAIILFYVWILYDGNKEKQKTIDFYVNEYKKIDLYVEAAKVTADEILKKAQTDAENVKKEISERYEICRKKQTECELLKVELDKKREEVEYIEKALNAKVKDIPLLVELFADIEAEKGGLIEQALIMKKNPSIKGSIQVANIKREKQKIIRELKALKYKIYFYEQIAPWLTDLEEESLDTQTKDVEVFNKEHTDEEDASGYWLTHDEYMTLPAIERYQKALDRYWNRHKSKWEIGADYERYTGYLFEANGFKVEYKGIIDGVEDRGRDLICCKNFTTVVVQCKYWSPKKQIHENHINQLFGTTLKYYLEVNPYATFEQFFKALSDKRIIPLIVTSTKLSDVAKKYAKALHVEVREEVKLEKYPMIKCNISRATKEKIYHLPFDQQYDKVKIDDAGEFYAMTVKEAEDKGFRRAKKWMGYN